MQVNKYDMKFNLLKTRLECPKEFLAHSEILSEKNDSLFSYLTLH